MTDLSRDQAEALVERPIDQWDGKCHVVSSRLAPALGGVVHRGFYLGPKAEGAYFHGSFSQHSWVAMPDGTVVDPTRHAFDLSPRWPLWTGPADDYDVGGCRSQPPSGRPPEGGARDQLVEIARDDLAITGITFVLPPEADLGNGRWALTNSEVFWLAGLPVKDQASLGVLPLEGGHAKRVYEALIASGRAEAIAIDRRAWVLGDFESTAALDVRYGGMG